MHQLSRRALPLHYRTSARKLLSLLLWKFLFYLLLCRTPVGNKSPESIQMTIESACNPGGLFSHLLDRVKTLYVKKRSALLLVPSDGWVRDVSKRCWSAHCLSRLCTLQGVETILWERTNEATETQKVQMEVY